MRVAEEWQLAQSFGVPRNMPCTWQDSHFTSLCFPVKGKPVVRWSKFFTIGLFWGVAAVTQVAVVAIPIVNMHPNHIVSFISRLFIGAGPWSQVVQLL